MPQRLVRPDPGGTPRETYENPETNGSSSVDYHHCSHRSDVLEPMFCEFRCIRGRRKDDDVPSRKRSEP